MSTSPLIDDSFLAEDGAPSSLLTFGLGRDTFGLNVMRVQEILDIVSVTRVPHANAFAPGVINVRGNVVPVIDLRHRFGLPPKPEGKSNRTVVFEVTLDGQNTRVAMGVDMVYNVEPLVDIEIEPLPESGTKWNKELIRGITRIRDQLTIILNLDGVFDTSIQSTKPLR
ncbi:MAG: chemotaxis protein CheW [Pseudomonadota bacterium]